MENAREGRAAWPYDWSPPAPAAPTVHLPDPAEVAEVFARGVEAMGAAMQQMAEQWATVVAPAVRQMHDQLAAAGLVPEQPPTDPRARALHLRRTRNTGPALRPLGRR